MSAPAASDLIVHVGTFTRMPPHPRGKAEGIAILRLNPATGQLAPVTTITGVDNPSFLALDPGRRFLYAVNAVPEDEGRPGGSVSAFAVDQTSGNLTYLNRQPSHGAGPCHVAVDPSGRWVYVANYGGGSVAMLPVEADGRLGPASDWHQHRGSSLHPERQTSPHAHSFTIDPAGRFGLVCDLGLDQVLIYRLDRDQGRLVPNTPPAATVPAGGGPRHLAFHPHRPTVYILNEIGSSITTAAYDAEQGRLEPGETGSTLPTDYRGENACADIHVHPSGRFVYASNRGHDSLAIFAVDAAGRLTPIGHQSTLGRIPRNFALDAAGRFLFVANQESDTVITFAIDAATGQLTVVGRPASVTSPVCLKFAGAV